MTQLATQVRVARAFRSDAYVGHGFNRANEAPLKRRPTYGGRERAYPPRKRERTLSTLRFVFSWPITLGPRVRRPEQREQRERIDAGVVRAHGPMQVRTGDAAGRAHLADDLAGHHHAAFLHIDGRQVRER